MIVTQCSDGFVTDIHWTKIIQTINKSRHQSRDEANVESSVNESSVKDFSSKSSINDSSSIQAAVLALELKKDLE